MTYLDHLTPVLLWLALGLGWILAVLLIIYWVYNVVSIIGALDGESARPVGRSVAWAIGIPLILVLLLPFNVWLAEDVIFAEPEAPVTEQRVYNYCDEPDAKLWIFRDTDAGETIWMCGSEEYMKNLIANHFQPLVELTTP